MGYPVSPDVRKKLVQMSIRHIKCVKCGTYLKPRGYNVGFCSICNEYRCGSCGEEVEPWEADPAESFICKGAGHISFLRLRY